MIMSKPADSNADFARNLRFLCSHYHSTSEVCRQLGINRQQFNKYITGLSRPSRHNIKRICDFFGVEEYEVLFPHAELKRLIAIKGVRKAEPEDDWAIGLRRAIGESESEIRTYYGYYFCYYHSFSYPGKILKSLMHLTEHDGMSVYKRIERLVERDRPNRSSYVYKYAGLAFFFRERIFLIDRETLTGSEISETVLYPSYRNRVGLLPGLTIGVAGNTSREPVAARIVLEHLGETVDAKAALRACGLYQRSTKAIDSTIREAIRNEIARGAFDLRASPR